MNKTKYALHITVIALLCILPHPYARASDLYSIKTLRDASNTHWKQSYQAYGRTIDIDIEYEIPQVNDAPVLKVEKWIPVDPEEYNKWALYFSSPYNQSQDFYGFQTSQTDERIDEGKMSFWFNVFDSSALFGKTKQAFSSDPRNADWRHSYAEDHPLSMREIFEFTQDKLNEVCAKDIPLYPLHGGMLGRLRDMSTGKALRDHGEYEMILAQTFHGIPLVGTIFETYMVRDAPAVGHLYYHTNVRSMVYDENSYEIQAALSQEIDMIYKDMPMSPFDLGKKQIEDLIERGLIRDIYHIRLAYVLFHNPDDLGNSFYLIPSWVVSCQFVKQADAEPYTGGWPEMYWNVDTYRNLIINAQTGKLYDPFSKDEDRFLAPGIIPRPDQGQ